MIKGLKDLGLFSLEKKRLERRNEVSPQHLKEFMNVREINGFKLNEGTFMLDVRGRFLLREREMRCWNRLPRKGCGCSIPGGWGPWAI